MPTKLNLASRPFNNRALPWMITAAVILVSLVSLVFIVRSTGLANAQANAVQNDINNLGRQEQALRQQAETIKNSLTSEQLQTLDAAHALVDRKHFSWSRLSRERINSISEKPALEINLSARSINLKSWASSRFVVHFSRD